MSYFVCSEPLESRSTHYWQFGYMRAIVSRSRVNRLHASKRVTLSRQHSVRESRLGLPLPRLPALCGALRVCDGVPEGAASRSFLSTLLCMSCFSAYQYVSIFHLHRFCQYPPFGMPGEEDKLAYLLVLG